MLQIKLNQPAIEYNTREWEIVEAWLKEELTTVYEGLANPSTSDDRTHQLRGRASLLKEMLGWKEERAALSRT